jgi:hypothetical protein
MAQLHTSVEGIETAVVSGGAVEELREALGGAAAVVPG